MGIWDASESKPSPAPPGAGTGAPSSSLPAAAPRQEVAMQIFFALSSNEARGRRGGAGKRVYFSPGCAAAVSSGELVFGFLSL